MQNRFVIVTHQRSGSNMLVSMLDSHPEIKCFGELMRATPGWMRREGYRGALRTLEKVDPIFREDHYRFSHPYEFVEAVFETARRKICGFKQHLDQNPAFLKQLIHDPGWNVLVLQRENSLAQYSSQKITQVTGQGSLPRGAKVIRATVEFKEREFVKFVNQKTKEWDGVFAALKAAGKSYLQVYYTELLSPQTATRMLEFLGVDPGVNIKPGTEKRNSSDILSRFTNQEAAAATLEKMGKLEWRREIFPSIVT